MYELQKKLQHESKPCTMYKKPCTVCCWLIYVSNGRV
jgi:hypothetical protein